MTGNVLGPPTTLVPVWRPGRLPLYAAWWEAPRLQQKIRREAQQQVVDQSCAVIAQLVERDGREHPLQVVLESAALLFGCWFKVAEIDSCCRLPRAVLPAATGKHKKGADRDR